MEPPSMLQHKELPSSDAETDRMEGIDERESQLEQLAEAQENKRKRNSESDDVAGKKAKVEDQKETDGTEENKEPEGRCSGKDSAQIEVKHEKTYIQGGADNNEQTSVEEGKHENKKQIEDGTAKKEEEVAADGNDEEEEEEEEEDGDDDEEGEGGRKGAEGELQNNVKERDNDANEHQVERKNKGLEEREMNRVNAVNDLKEIEILFAQLKDKLYETQLTKLEFELKLCENNQHPELLDYMRMIDEDFKKKTERLMNLQKYQLKTLDNQTRATRVAIHQQFMKLRQDIKQEEVVKITTDWYDINKERKVLDMQAMGLPEYYQYNRSINSYNIQQYIPSLINQRNSTYRELAKIQGLINYKEMFPSSLNNLKGCTRDELDEDLKDLGLFKNGTAKKNSATDNSV